MSLPIFAYAFIWPMSDAAQLVVFTASNIWTFLLRKLPLVHEPLLASADWLMPPQMTAAASFTQSTIRIPTSTFHNISPSGIT